MILPKKIINRDSGKSIARTDRLLRTRDETKHRITIYLDAAIVAHYKQAARDAGVGYQTLINRALRQTVQANNVLPQHIKEDLLKDSEFLESLKSALYR